MTAPSVAMARPKAPDIDGIKVQTQGGLVRLDVYVAGELVATTAVPAKQALAFAILVVRRATKAEFGL